MGALTYHLEAIVPELLDNVDRSNFRATFTRMKRNPERASIDTMDAVEQRLRALILAGLDGDQAAYHAFLTELTGRLRAFVRRRLYQLQDEVEDIVQETLLAVHNARHTYRAEEPLTAWVHAIARYKLMDFLRSRSRQGVTEPLDDLADVLSYSDEVPANDARLDINGLLQQLPDKQRLPIQHVKLEGLSVAETARLTGLSESAVKVGIHRGLKALAAKARLLTS
ncbi:MAG: sigma-70 family RNA polymerase sigma factor [Cupriavidus sp.]|nr:sigma-70 family RNA polymerase sigma factor [Cupriavidus sp.]